MNIGIGMVTVASRPIVAVNVPVVELLEANAALHPDGEVLVQLEKLMSPEPMLNGTGVPSEPPALVVVKVVLAALQLMVGLTKPPDVTNLAVVPDLSP